MGRLKIFEKRAKNHRGGVQRPPPPPMGERFKQYTTNVSQTLKLTRLLLTGLNKQIIHVIKQQTEKTLQAQVKLPNQKVTNLLFLINEYLDHMEHHVKQIIDS